jgi:Flp pilus assembly CpaE family ATPase
MRVTRRVAARTIFDEHALDALAGNVRQLVLVDEGHLGVLRLRRISEDAAEL